MSIILVIPYNPLEEVSGLELTSVRMAGEFIRQGHSCLILTIGPSGTWENCVSIIGCPNLHAIGRWLINHADIYDIVQWMEIFPKPEDAELQYLLSFLLKSHLHKQAYLMVATLGNMRSRGGGPTWLPIVRHCMNGFVVFNQAQVEEMQDCGIPSEMVHPLAAGIDTKKIFRPPSPTEKQTLRAKHGWEGSKSYFLYIGRFVDRKRPDFLMRVWSEMSYIHSRAELVLVGSGMGHPESIEEVVHNLAVITPAVRILPHVLETWQYYRAADAVVIPSIREGSPMVLWEAMACGLPVIASSIPGISDIITDGENGILCNPNLPQDFAKAMWYLVDNPEKARELGQKARESICDAREIQIVIERYLSLYSEGPACFRPVW